MTPQPRSLRRSAAAARGAAAFLALALAAALSGCQYTFEDGPSPTPSPAVTRVSLSLGTDDEPPAHATALVTEFAGRVNRLSGGSLFIDWRWGVAKGPNEGHQVVARQVRDGVLDLGFVPASAWDRLGVTSFRALSTPFLIRSEEGMARVAGSDVAREMLDGVGRLGLTGLALVPEDMRTVFSAQGPLDDPARLAGARVHTPASDTVEAFFEGLGARTHDDDRAAEAVVPGTMRLEDASYLSVDRSVPLVATGNLPLFATFDVLVVNTSRLAQLSGQHRQILVEAAEGTALAASGAIPTRADGAKTHCSRFGSVVNISPGQLAAFEAAAKPAVDALRADRETGGFIARLEALGVDAPGTDPAPCGT